MVRVGSAQRIENQKRLKKIILLIVIILGLILLSFVLIDVISRDKDKSSSPAKEYKVSNDLAKKIDGLVYKVSQPERIPEDYKRASVNFIKPSQSKSGCEEVRQQFVKTNDTSKEYIDVYSYDSSCAFPRPDDAQGFSIGDYAGWVSDTDKKLSVLFEITVNESMLRIETDLSRKNMNGVLIGFEPFKKEPPKDSLKLSK